MSEHSSEEVAALVKEDCLNSKICTFPDCECSPYISARTMLERLQTENKSAGDWVMVPRVATYEMIEAYAHAGKSVFFSSAEACAQYQAMLEAAPKPPAPVPLADEALAKELYEADWPHQDYHAKWAKHRELRDLAYRRYCNLADIALRRVSQHAPAQKGE